ncbi:MAG: hypothetical protein LBR60_09230 [Fibrobacter sp.]|jgi:hypothetical protein|nr:hypothetical protein [Fibrobacter sp.]
MKLRKFLILASLLLLAACSSVPKATVVSQDSSRDIPAIDHMIVNLKNSYIDQCYKPVMKKNPPENHCQTALFQMLERRYHRNYSQKHLNMASDDLFFRDVEGKLREMMRTNPEVKNAIRRASFRSQEEVFAYYKGKYTFNTEIN